MEKPGRLQSMGSIESDTTERLHFHFSLSHNGEGNGNPLQCSCLENPRDGGAWWAAVYGVTQSQTKVTQQQHTNQVIYCIPILTVSVIFIYVYTLILAIYHSVFIAQISASRYFHILNKHDHYFSILHAK